MIEFKPCPDCGYEGYPLFDRRDMYSGFEIISSNVRAFCNTCNWGTGFHANVKECAEDWNNAKVVSE